MINEKATDLARRCTELIRKEESFVSIWNTVLKRHALIEGIPHEKLDHQRAILCIPLITGEQLVFDDDFKEFRIE
jgi:hypothetical protein